MTDYNDKPMNERALTAEEKRNFLVDLSTLCLEYGVSFDVENNYEGYESYGSLDICDHFGRTIFESNMGFDDSDAKEILGK